jgi:serine/threonine protein kinase
MAPEQVRGQAVDHRADIFALGAILYELLSGQRAFRGSTTADTASAILKDDPPDLPAERHLPPGLVRIVQRCVEKDPAARFQSIRDLEFALDALSATSSSPVADVATRHARPRESILALRWLWPLIPACAVAFAASLLVKPTGVSRPPQRLEVAR